MKQEQVNHVCEDCALRKEIVIENVDDEDVDVYNTIQTGISTAQASNDPSIIPDGVSEEKMKAYFEAAIAKEAHYKKLEMEWWQKMMKKYNISDKTKIDPMQKKFYKCVDENNQEQIYFESKPDKAREKLEVVK
jgi:hypothetical protein